MIPQAETAAILLSPSFGTKVHRYTKLRSPCLRTPIHRSQKQLTLCSKAVPSSGSDSGGKGGGAGRSREKSERFRVHSSVALYSAGGSPVSFSEPDVEPAKAKAKPVRVDAPAKKDLWPPVTEAEGAPRSCLTTKQVDFGYPRGFYQQYERLEKLGSGGFGVVYRVKNLTTKQEYAVKILKKKGAPQTKVLERIRNEVMLQQAMHSSTGVTHLHHVFEDNKKVYLVMELCSGGHLWSRIKKGQYSEAKAAKLVRAALQCIADCHGQGIMLRDIKPHNFLFLNSEAESPLLITDFGLAVRFDPRRYDDEPFTRTVGTSGYLAPEVSGRASEVAGLRKVKYGPKADMWSLGALSYQLLCGKLPSKQSRPSLKTGELFPRVIESGPIDWECDAYRVLSEEARSFLRGLLHLDPKKRLSCRQALAHPWLTGEVCDVPFASKGVCPGLYRGIMSSFILETVGQRIQRYFLFDHPTELRHQNNDHMLL